MADKIWVLARTQPSRENWAAENVKRQGCEFYLPQFEEEVMVGRRGSKKIVTMKRPLFPSYLFVHTMGQWRFLLGTFGVSSVMQENGTAAIVPDSAIDQLRSREVNGLIVLPSRQSRHFEKGDSVRVTEGSFLGYQGIYEGLGANDRVKVLLDFMGRKTPILIGEGSLESAK